MQSSSGALKELWYKERSIRGDLKEEKRLQYRIDPGRVRVQSMPGFLHACCVDPQIS